MASTSRAVPTEACHERRKPPSRKDEAEGCAGTLSSRRTETFAADAYALESFASDAFDVRAAAPSSGLANTDVAMPARPLEKMLMSSTLALSTCLLTVLSDFVLTVFASARAPAATSDARRAASPSSVALISARAPV